MKLLNKRILVQGLAKYFDYGSAIPVKINQQMEQTLNDANN